MTSTIALVAVVLMLGLAILEMAMINETEKIDNTSINNTAVNNTNGTEDFLVEMWMAKQTLKYIDKENPIYRDIDRYTPYIPTFP